MALRTIRPIVDYPKQLGTSLCYNEDSTQKLTSLVICYSAAFEDFLTSFKSSETSAASALENLNIDEDGLSEEYDFLEDADELNGAAAPNNSRRHQQDPKQKYMEILQSVADRHTSEVCVELDDLELYEKSLGDEADLKLVDSIERNARRYIDILSEAVDKVMPKETREIS